jgi:ribosomal protein S18 acetylase RimI-like enzyme
VIEIRQATAGDAGVLAEILQEAAAWADARGGDVLWQLDELSPERLAGEIARGQFFIAWSGDTARQEAAGTVRFQLEDDEFWPDDPGDHATYIHRLAVRRSFAGGAVSTALLAWALQRTRALRRRVLRLDCDADRTGLRAVYERFGFTVHSYRQVGPYYVARYELPA